MALLVKIVTSWKQSLSFINFPHELHKDDPNYVPEIYLSQKEIHNPKKNPFFKHSEVCSFLVYDEKKIVGRISSILNHRYNEFHKCNVGFFGFFDCVNDKEVSTILFNQAKDWLIAKGVHRMIGPTNFSLTTDTGGLLIDGFQTPPIVMMTYNPPYYKHLVEAYGFTKTMDLYAYMILTKQVSTKSLELYTRLEQRLKKQDITIRTINLKHFKKEVATIKKIYDSAWENNWGFNPPSVEEFNHLAEGLKMIIDPSLAFIAEYKNEVIGFAISLPNINEVMIHQKKGRIIPFGLVRLLLKKTKTKYLRVALLGVKKNFRKKGIEAIFFAKTIKIAKQRGVIGGEASWVLENNEMMIKAAKKLNGKKYKTYRIYDVAL